jgi:hypothetical protein
MISQFGGLAACINEFQSGVSHQHSCDVRLGSSLAIMLGRMPHHHLTCLRSATSSTV